MSKEIYFWKNKTKKTLAMCTQELGCAHSFLHAYVGSILRTHSEFQKLYKTSFLH